MIYFSNYNNRESKETTLELNKVTVISYPILLLLKEIFYFEIFQASPTRPSDKSNM
jgi:hypothetical protein